MPPIKGKMLSYPEEQMEAAIAAVSAGEAVARAAKTYNVPRATLTYKIKGITPRERRMGPNPILREDEEKVLVTWIFSMAKAGFPIGKDTLLDSVQHLIIDLKRTNPFTNNRPGRKWYESFLRRHPEVAKRTAQNLTISRSSVTKEHLQAWFKEVRIYLDTNGYSSILEDPSRVFNSDETAFFLNPKGGKVLAPKGDKSVYQQVNSDEKECLTVLVTGNAAGQIPPPMVVFRYDRIPKEIAMSIPENWGIGKSESGWMTGETFFEFITNIFHPWLLGNNITLPIILFIDGHASHLNLHTSRFCADNGIILTALFPNATHLIQPMDLAVFRTLKEGWKTKVQQWRIDNHESPVLKKVHFCPLLNTLLQERLTPSILQNGFRKCGLVPWNPQEVTLPLVAGKIESNIKHRATTSKNIDELKQGLQFLEKLF
ncbi:jerky protein homolog-like [Sitophilus oryzae]|uniref:Jerky protein homolog-like n=1 Tax=Sitophilus oryzae TaxID=7048 RepID=A0A6J2XLG4_SITOR|nr:jerky protein homolog-like [Sitophilus oryzae]